VTQEKRVFESADSWVLWKITNKRATKRDTLKSIIAGCTKKKRNQTGSEWKQFPNLIIEILPPVLKLASQVFANIYLPPRQ
jgi:glycerol kinase